MKSRFAAALGAGLLFLAFSTGGVGRPARTGAGKRKGLRKSKKKTRTCKGRRYDCEAKRPRDYDRRVRVIYRPARGQNRACLRRLRRSKIRFRMLSRVKGVQTPVEILSKKLGGVRYRKSWNNKRRFILDCRMAEVLAARGRAIRRAGIATVYFSSSWRYSVVKGTQRLSQHAYGLALDVIAIDGRFGYASVARHYEKGIWGCGSRNRTARGKAWRGFYCALHRNKAFSLIMTPDTDRAHRDHFHVEGPNPAIFLKVRERKVPKRRLRR
jgi:hypothetical protein